MEMNQRDAGLVDLISEEIVTLIHEPFFDDDQKEDEHD